jgi:4-hydroxy-2-oxoheptanedioate aldolase
MSAGSAHSAMSATPAERLLARRGPLLGSFSVLGDPAAAETLAGQGLDFVLIDLQHGLATLDRLVAHLTAVESAGALALVRVADQSASSVGQVLDRGAAAVVVPQVDNADQARAVAAACQYPPRGGRSFGPVRAGRPPAFAPGACLAMIESARAVQAVDEIAAVPGLSGLFVGPTDLAIDLGLGPDYDVSQPRHDAAVTAVLAACRRHGLVAGVQTPSAEVARRRLAQGFDLVSVRSDRALLSTAARSLREDTGRSHGAHQDESRGGRDAFSRESA